MRSAKKEDGVKELKKIGKERPSEEGENRLDRIDKEITKTMLKQEKEIAKQKKRPKTKKLNRAILNHLLWKIAMSAIRNKRDFSERLNEIARKIKRKEDDEQWNDVKTVTIELRKARKERRNLERQVKEELKEERETNFVENLPSFSDPEQEKKKKRAIEKQKRQFRQIKESLRKKSTGCIAHIVVPEPEREYPYKPEEVAEWREVYDPKEVEEELLRRSKAHFSQAEKTPFATKEVLEKLPVHGRLSSG